MTDTKSKDAAQGAQGIEPFVETTQIRFTGPQGMKVLIGGEPWELIAPGRHNFVRHASEARRYDLGFMKAPGAPDRQFAALLDIFPSTPDTEEFLTHNGVPITLTDEDTYQASTKLLIKVIYLHKPSGVKAAIPEVKTLLSTAAFQVDVIAAASEFGTILAVLRLAENADHLGKLEPKSSNTPVTRPKPASKTGAEDQADNIVVDLYGGSQVLPGLGKNPGYSKLVQSLNALKGVTTNFREAGKGDAIVMAMIHDPSQRCQREAQQTQKESELRVAINSALKVAGIQSVRWEENTATAEVEKVAGNSASTPKADQVVVDLYGGSGVLWGLSKNPNHDKLIQSLNALSGVVTNFRVVDEGTAISIAIVRDPSRRCLKETQRTQKESELRVDINSALKAAGIEATRWDEGSDAKSADKSEAESATSNQIPLDAEDAAALILEKLGVKFGTPVDANGAPSEYHGGMPIIEVIENSAASKAGFRKGDILVAINGLGMLSLNDVVRALRHQDTPPKIGQPLSLRADLVRDGKTVSAEIVLAAQVQVFEDEVRSRN